VTAARAALVAGIVERLDGVLDGCAVFDAPPVRGGLPYAEVGEPVLADWSGTGWTGRDGRVSVALHDGGERPVRLRGLVGAVEELAAPAVDGWRVVRWLLVRSRMARSGERWSASVEFQVRMVRAE